MHGNFRSLSNASASRIIFRDRQGRARLPPCLLRWKNRSISRPRWTAALVLSRTQDSIRGARVPARNPQHPVIEASHDRVYGRQPFPYRTMSGLPVTRPQPVKRVTMRFRGWCSGRSRSYDLIPFATLAWDRSATPSTPEPGRPAPPPPAGLQPQPQRSPGRAAGFHRASTGLGVPPRCCRLGPGCHTLLILHGIAEPFGWDAELA
jgi:hypothetical protein